MLEKLEKLYDAKEKAWDLYVAIASLRNLEEKETREFSQLQEIAAYAHNQYIEIKTLYEEETEKIIKIIKVTNFGTKI